ncbi:hypothetical protein CAOG_07525 [Capsaspora owczarzaki ATCC 30864]|uniref:hypothetical protein n=1 Tax=Capsaspora owczarzaki (strain ATCC 30864) TaxID=595528 RepID=UPI0001FE4FC6|nr:hypothetical protein CAOG_07525 [Capsaspora owczarzaki ATCC 30864]|eukprot:XP_004343399.1 hypothetical protein CAOG_07525 [Capsaspora owczarzaki ATCC 30864]
MPVDDKELDHIERINRMMRASLPLVSQLETELRVLPAPDSEPKKSAIATPSVPASQPKAASATTVLASSNQNQKLPSQPPFVRPAQPAVFVKQEDMQRVLSAHIQKHAHELDENGLCPCCSARHKRLDNARRRLYLRQCKKNNKPATQPEQLDSQQHGTEDVDALMAFINNDKTCRATSMSHRANGAPASTRTVKA